MLSPLFAAYVFHVQHSFLKLHQIFAHHESQRSWIIEEILSSLIKLYSANQKAGQFRLRDGRSIRTVSALLMQLVQTSAHDVRVQAHGIAKKRRAQVAMRQSTYSESQVSLDGPPEEFLDELDLEVTTLPSFIDATPTLEGNPNVSSRSRRCHQSGQDYCPFPQPTFRQR